MSSSMAEASASALERFLMTKFRTTTPPLPPSSCGAINGNFYSTGDQNGYDSRSNTLTMHTFRPNDDTYNSAYGSHGNTFSSSMNAATPPQKPFITPAMYCPQSEPSKLVKPSAYYESTAAYRANMIGTVQNFPHPLSSLIGNAVPNGQHRALMKPPINTAGMYDMYVAPEDATAAVRHANTNGSLRYDVDDTNIASYPCNKMNIYTYEEESIVIYLENSNERVGFSMGGGADESLDSFINSVTPGTAADRAGLCIGDEIIEVNGTPVEGKEHAEIVRLIHKCIKSRIIQLRVRRKQTVDGDSGVDSESAVPAAANPELKISDAYLVSVDKEHIKEVGKKLKRNYPGIKTYDMETIAAEPSDRIPEPVVNAVQNSNQTPAAIQQKMLPNGGAAVEDGFETAPAPLSDQMERLKQYEKDLKKRRELDEQRAKEDAFLRASLRGSKKLQALEDKDAQAKLELANGKALNEKTVDMGYSNKCYVTSDVSYRENLDKMQSEAIPLEQVIISVNRVASHLEQSEGRPEESKIIRDYFTQEPIQKAIEAAAVHRSSQMTNQKPTTSSDISSTGEQMGITEMQGGLKIVRLTKYDDTYLGATVRNEGDKVIVGRVVKGGVAERSHLLREGDELVEANGHDLRGRSVTEVCDILRSISGELSLVVVPSSKIEIETETDRTNRSVIRHMRALFDYEPEDDFYVPCKELALKFQRGDILHVISTSDENWWQAYREGDDPSSSLAGLIPSTHFQQQVILYNRELERENTSDSSTKRKDFFGCTKKKSLGKAKGKRIVQDEMKSADEVSNDDSEMLTYEEVSLYMSKGTRKRPIVLCGPEGVGCLELRQRLVESDKSKFASAVPHTTRPKKSGELDDVHFHFVTRQKFQEDAKMGKFIEYGEYQKHLYGTSIAAIQSVVNRGKICLLTLKAENLKALRRTSLMPYVVFIAPPSLQQLKRQKESLGQFNVKEEQLKLTLNEGKLTEQEYGHLFDHIIVNIDLDRSLNEMKDIVRKLETEPQWVPSFWLNRPEANYYR